MKQDYAPIIGAWYINTNNQFLRIWGTVYHEGIPDKVVLQYLNGMRFIIPFQDWFKLELAQYPDDNRLHNGSVLA